ncbi:MAG: radical SAM protein [Candidatus Omnitrophota bacterium]
MIWNTVSFWPATHNAQRTTKDECVERGTLRFARFFMKVLLLQPPVQDFYNTDIRLQPIGLAHLKAAAQKHLPGVRITIKDFHHGWGRRTIAFPRELAYLKDYYSRDDKSPFSTFHHYYHFGADFDTIAGEVTKAKPDLVGIASLFAPYCREVLRCAEAIKKRCQVPILLGGSQVSAMPEHMLSHPAIDFVIRGEGEKPFVELLKVLRDGGDLKYVPNLGYKKRGRLVLNSRKENYPIENLPFPDLSDLPQDHYLFEKKPLCFIITSRGCSYRCAFCSVHKTFGRKCRRRSAGNILAEIRQRYAEGYRVFDFEDDNLTFDRKEMRELCGQLIRTFPQKDIQLLAMNGVCYWTLDRDILKLMRQAGFTHLNLSLVSTSTGLLKTVQRPGPLKKYREVIRHATALGFKIVVYQILGLPGDTLASMIKTLLFNAKLPVLLGASPFYLTPHSPIARRFGGPSETDIYKARLTAMAIETKDFKREDLYTLLITTRILNFLKGLLFHSKEITLSKALAIAKKQDARSAMGSRILRKLLREKILYAATPKGFEPLPRFKPGLFFQLWQKLDIIKTRE